ncbi:olfactory receptor 2K2-like [Scomber japonicus]|uniref:olfactory receptor 2K2-like n=1 Tax=Scomber japonicus TaxID=13676 RepID=UPI0023066B75|nr:olfactory receptor 2K2-like [Scomber japonicus]
MVFPVLVWKNHKLLTSRNPDFNPIQHQPGLITQHQYWALLMLLRLKPQIPIARRPVQRLDSLQITYLDGFDIHVFYRTLLFWMENLTTVTSLKQPIVFELEGFFVPPGYSPLLFFLALLNYIVVLLGNGVVFSVIVIDKSLHRPMFILVCNLVVCDLLGATAVLPRLMIHFLTGQKRIAYILAIAQAFCVHTYGAAVQTILGAMAYDRYIAVCEPLRYHAIMTSARLHFCCALAWFIALLLIAVLFAFHINTPLCGNIIRHVYCTNRTIMNLACSPTLPSNIYGLSMTWSLSTGIFLIIAFSYIRILHASVKRGRSDSSAQSKALRTCAPHLVVYLLFEIASLIIIVSYRFPSVSQNIKKFCSILFIIIPPVINPIIYGLVSKELRGSIIKQFITQVSCKK